MGFVLYFLLDIFYKLLHYNRGKKIQNYLSTVVEYIIECSIRFFCCCCFQKKYNLVHAEAVSISKNGEIRSLPSLTPINESIKPCSWIYFFPTPYPTPLSFSFFHFLASDTSSSSLSRTESPLQVFVSSHLPHPKSDTFVWPHAASPCCDQVPEPCSPSHCKLVFSS